MVGEGAESISKLLAECLRKTELDLGAEVAWNVDKPGSFVSTSRLIGQLTDAARWPKMPSGGILASEVPRGVSCRGQRA